MTWQCYQASGGLNFLEESVKFWKSLPASLQSLGQDHLDCRDNTLNYVDVGVQSLSRVLILCNPTDSSMSGSRVLHYLLEFAQMPVH